MKRILRRLWLLVAVHLFIYLLMNITGNSGKHTYEIIDETSQETKDTADTARDVVQYSSSRLNRPKTDTIEILSNASIAIILAYMRSGSSFTGASLQAVPNTFYLFEPVSNICKEFGRTVDPLVPILYPNGTIIHYNREDKHRVMMQEIENYLTCRLGNVSVVSLSDGFHKSRTVIMKKLQQCTVQFEEKGASESVKPLISFGNWTRCLEEVRQDCLTAPVRLVKLIRVLMSDMKNLMPKFPNMKILHLNRDPRAIFNSRIRSGFLKVVEFNKTAVPFCDRWFRDIEITKDLAKEFPGRIKRVRFEDIVQNPNKMLKDISNFFDMDFEPGIRNFLIRMTNVTKDGGPMSLNRVDPYQTSIQWRNQINFTEAEYFSKLCEAGMREMNYMHFSNEQDMNNLDIPFRGPLQNLDGYSIT